MNGGAAPTTIPARASVPVPPDPPAPPVYLVPTLLGALSVLAASIAIPPMISGNSWLWPTVEVVMVIWLVGVGARLARVPAVAVVLFQIAGAFIAMTALFTVGGIGGVIPNGAVLTEAGDLLTGAWEQIRTTVSPAPASTELAFLICLSVGATALIVDLLIAVCRAPALVALPLLCVYSVPASIDLSMLPWEAFAAPAMLYAILLTASGLSGRRLGAGAGLAQVITGVGLAALAIVISLLVAQAVPGVGTAGRLPRSTSGPGTGIGLSPFASLQGNLQRADPVDMLRVRGLDQPRYLRTVGLQRWTNGQGFSVDELTAGPVPADPRTAFDPKVTITALSYRDRFLPIYNGTTAVNGVDGGWTYDSALESVHRADDITPDPYQVTAAAPEHSAEALRADTVTPGGTLTETDNLPAEVVTLADQVTAGASTAFDKADALRNYFTNPANGFTYSLTVPTGDSGDGLVDFLRLKQGFCEQYASAMAIMLRAVGVPARVAIGFTQGTLDPDGSYLISSNDAHAWVEVLFNNAGWVQFDPTPLGGGQGGQQGFTDTATPTPTTAAASSQASVSAAVSGGEPTRGAGAAAALPSEDATSSGTAAEGPLIPAGLWWALALVVAAAAAASGPTLVRNRRRASRLAAADGGGRDAAAAAWREIEDLAVDHGIGLDGAESARATANRLAKAAHLTEQGRGELRTLVTRLEQSWYAGDDSPSVVPTGTAGADRGAGGSAGEAGLTTGANGADGSVGAAANGTATAVTRRPGPAVSLGAAPRTMATELRHLAPLSLLDKLVPRSVRPAWWRD